MTFDKVQTALRRLRAVDLHFEEQRVWEASVPSTEARKVLNGLNLTVSPRVLPPLA
ncbi:MAG: hypothetical protein ABH877_00240 [bacterium]